MCSLGHVKMGFTFDRLDTIFKFTEQDDLSIQLCGVISSCSFRLFDVMRVLAILNSCNLYFCNLQFAFLTSLHLSSFDPTYFNFKSFSFAIYLKFLFPPSLILKSFVIAILISTEPSNSKEWSFEKVLVNMITKIPCDRFG